MDQLSKKEKIDKIRLFVNSPLSGSTSFAGLNMCDIYLNIRDRDYVLSTLQERFPHATEDLSSAEEWAEKLQSLKTNQTYISGFTGQVGENKAVETLEKLGFKTKPFESLTHKDNDLQGINGGPDWSVKSYEDLNNFKKIVNAHPSSDHYVVNSELYEKLESSGDLQYYSQKGIVIIDGKFSHRDSVELAKERLDVITGDITDEIYDGILDDIPIVAGIVILCNIGINIYRYQTGKSSKDEAYIDILKGMGKISAASGGAAAGGIVGASIGSVIFPLAGTLIGGGVGAFLGSMGARELIDNVSINLEWGNSLKTYKYLAEKYEENWPHTMNEVINQKYFHLDSIKKNLLTEENRFAKFKPELDLNQIIEPSISAVIIHETIKRLERSIDVIQRTSKQLQDELISFCIEFGINRYPREREKSKNYAKLMYGAVLAENSEWLIIPNNSERELISKMKSEFKRSPNNPFKLKYSKEELLGAIAMSTLTKEGHKS